MKPKRGTVVIGIGNVIRSDDGLGVHVVRLLQDRGRCAEDVTLIEGGTAGLMLLPQLADADRAIIVDAVSLGNDPGTLVRLDNAEGAFATGKTPHDVGLSDLLDAARLTSAWPNRLVLHGAQPASTAFGTELSPDVVTSLRALVEAIEAELESWSEPS
jgi:hydrogenase maturation protease